MVVMMVVMLAEPLNSSPSKYDDNLWWWPKYKLESNNVSIYTADGGGHRGHKRAWPRKQLKPGSGQIIVTGRFKLWIKVDCDLLHFLFLYFTWDTSEYFNQNVKQKYRLALGLSPLWPPLSWPSVGTEQKVLIDVSSQWMFPMGTKTAQKDHQ